MKQKRLQKEKVNHLKQYAGFQIRSNLITQGNFVKVSSKLESFIIALSNIQILGFLIILYQEQNNQNQQYVALNILYYLSKLARPYQFIDFNHSLQQVYFLLPLLLLLFILFGTFIIYLLYVKEHKDNSRSQDFLQYFSSMNTILKAFCAVQSYTSSMMMYILVVPFFELSLISCKIALQYLTTIDDYFCAIFAVITLLLTISYAMVCFMVNLESTNLQCKSLTRLNITILDLLELILKLLIVVIYVVDLTLTIKIYLLAFAICGASFIQLKNIYTNYIKADKECISVMISMQTLNITISTIYLVLENLHQEANQYSSTLVLILYPLLNFLLLKVYEDIHWKCITQSTPDDHPKKLQYQLAHILKFIYNKSQQNLILENFIVLSHHRGNCHKPKCFCKSESLTPIHWQELMTLYARYIAHIFAKQIHCLRSPQEKFSYYIHYITSINTLGNTTQAFQQTNLLLYQETKSSMFQSEQKLEFSNYNFQRNQSGPSQQSSSQERNSQMNKQSQSNHNNQLQHTNIKSSQLTFLQKQKIQLIQEYIKSEMSQNFVSDSKNDSDDLSHSVNLFLQSEYNNQEIRDSIVRMIVKKKQFFSIIMNPSNQSTTILFNVSKKLSIKLKALEDKLLKLYEAFPSQKIQSLNAFYQSEIMNNYLQAYKIANITTISDEKLMKMHKNMQISLFSNKITYLIVGFDHQSNSMKISGRSNQVHQFFNYDIETFNNQTNIQPLIPWGLQRVHKQFIQEFMQNGKSKFFRQIGLNFCMVKNYFIKPVDFFFEINFQNHKELTFAVFFQEITYQSSYIIVGPNGKIGGITQNLLQKFGFPHKLIKKISVPQFLYKMSINKLIPDFSKYINSRSNKSNFQQELEEDQQIKRQETIKLYQANLQFMKWEYFEQNDLTLQSNRSVAKMSIKKQDWSKSSQLNYFHGDLIIESKIYDEFQYFIIEINDIKKVKKDLQQTTTNFGSESIQKGETIHEDHGEYKPQEVIQELQDESNPSNQTINFDNNKDNIFNLSHLDISIEELVNAPRAIEKVQDEGFDVSYDSDQFGVKLKVTSDQKIVQVVNNESLKRINNVKSPSNQEILLNNQIALFSPHNQSYSGLMSKDPQLQKSTTQREQQRFFQSLGKGSESESLQYLEEDNQDNNKKYKNFQQVDMGEMDKDIQENLMMQLQMKQEEKQNVIQIDDIGSQVSSLAGFRKSKFFKKYEVIDKLIKSKKQPKQYLVMNIFVFLAILTSIIYSIISIQNVKTDLNRFLKEIDMLQINSHFMAPIDKFILSQYAAVGYIINAYFFQLYDVPTATKYMKFSVEDINSTYYTLKQNFKDQLTNPYLDDFFTDNYIEIRQFSYDSLESTNITFRESLYLLLGNAYQFTNIDFYKVLEIQVNQSFLIYPYANYIVLSDKLQVLNSDILAYTMHRTDLVQDRWLMTLIPCLIIGFVNLVIGWVFFRLYLKKYSRILSFYKFIDNVWLQRDVERYRILIDLLSRDNDVMFKYTFDIDVKEKFLAAEELKKEKLALNQKKEKNKFTSFSNKSFRLPMIKSIIAFGLFYLVFFGYGFYINQTTANYLEKYRPSANFFKAISDLSIALSGAYSLREVCYYSVDGQLFFFLNNQTNVRFRQQIQHNLDTMSNFLIIMGNTDMQTFIIYIYIYRSSLLASDKFIYDYQNIRGNDICEYIPKVL